MVMSEMIVVLGATGYVGQGLVPALVATGRRVILVARRRPTTVATGARFAVCDTTDRDALTAVLGAADLIVNAVAGSPSTIVRTAVNLVSVLARPPRRRLVHLSSLAVFGQGTGMLSEATVPLPPTFHAYAAAKLLAEAALLAASSLRPNCFILRPGCIYGVGAPVWSDRIGRLLLAGRLGWLGPAARGWCPIVHVDDVVRAILAALESADHAAGVHHVIAAEALTWNRFFVRFGLHLGLSKVASIGPARLAAETWLVTPFDRLRARFGHAGGDVITPSMRRLFRRRAIVVQQRAPLLAPLSLRPLDAGLAEAAASLLQYQAGAGRWQRSLAPG
jgi:nucleoside-diphosphate-sugar epimerase